MCPLNTRFILASAITHAMLASAGYARPNIPSTMTPEPADQGEVFGLEGDYDNDCRVGFGDVSWVLSAFAPRGVFGMHDVEVVLANFGRVCVTTPPGDDKAAINNGGDAASAPSE